MLLAGFLTPVCAQVRIDSGAIAGTVSDAAAGRVRGAAVVLTQAGRGVLATSRTGDDGGFRFQSVPPASYSVRVEAAGFESREVENVAVAVGETVFLPLDLTLEPAVFSATVQAEAPILDFERAQQASILSSTRIDNLPINRRNYIDFALLTPGVTESATTANAADYRVPVFQTSGLSFAGGNGRGNTFAIDGLDNGGTIGNVRPGVSQAAVQEFSVNRSSYSAELGGGHGGAVNIVTKSGANDLHANLFGFLRQSSLQARNYFDYGPSKASFTRSQAGAAVGGPIRKDRLFYFGSVERLDQHEAVFVPILEDRRLLDALTPSQKALTEYLAGSPETRGLASVLDLILRPGSNPAVRSQYNQNSGVFPFSAASTQISARIDQRFSESAAFFWRANLTSRNEENTRFGALAGYSRGVSDAFRDGAFAAGAHLSFGPRWLSVSRLSAACSRYSGSPNDPYSPEINVDGAGYFGRNSQYPYARREIHLQFQQTFSFTAAAHTLKFGADYNPVRAAFEVVPWNGGRFEFASALPLALVLNAVTGDPAFSASLGNTLASAGRFDLAQSLGEPITSLQAFSLGLPVAYFQGFGAGRYDTWLHRASLFVEENWRAGRRLFLNAGLRFQGEADEGVRYLRNFAPRLGFTWSPASSLTWLIRGGAGLFYAFNDSLIPYATWGFKPENNRIVLAPLTGVPSVVNPATGAPVNSADVWRTLLAEGIVGARAIQYSDLLPLGFAPGFATPATGDLSPAFRSRYSTQVSLEIERSAGPYAFSVGYAFSRGVHLPRVRDYNLTIAGVRPDGWPIFGRLDPALLSNYVIESTGNSWYNAVYVEVSRRLRRRWTFNVSYTLSRALDDVTDYGFDFAAHNQFDNSAEKGLSLFHQKHRFVGSFVYQSPQRAGTGIRARLWSNWTASGIFRANSFRPFNVLTGFDNLGDNLTTTHRPLGLGRNAGIGPGFAALDARLARRIPLPGERVTLEFTGEAFNLTNHTNFVSVNNIVGAMPLAALPNPLKGHRGYPTEPLAFTAAAEARQVQLGLRIQF
ncbi:MAG: TonB-dependent receptor [Bryobacteraceae bacterium]|nr:TonB-dependent receptor [Bryobacteraceae bacterium]